MQKKSCRDVCPNYGVIRRLNVFSPASRPLRLDELEA